MRFNNIDLETGTFEGEDGALLDALSSVFMIHWEGEEPSYVEILAIARQQKPCMNCGEIGETGVSVLTQDGEIQSCSICNKISRVSSLVFKETEDSEDANEDSIEEKENGSEKE
tara:strand:+ start:744 stop:1085 length:342 start_codon:yes stop_codon:yes gene_type:complete